MEAKICGQCGELKPLEDFNVMNSSPDGHQGYCRDCSNNYSQAYNKGQRNPRK